VALVITPGAIDHMEHIFQHVQDRILGLVEQKLRLTSALRDNPVGIITVPCYFRSQPVYLSVEVMLLQVPTVCDVGVSHDWFRSVREGLYVLLLPYDNTCSATHVHSLLNAA
jgi:hypothetical protein